MFGIRNVPNLSMDVKGWNDPVHDLHNTYAHMIHAHAIEPDWHGCAFYAAKYVDDSPPYYSRATAVTAIASYIKLYAPS